MTIAGDAARPEIEVPATSLRSSVMSWPMVSPLRQRMIDDIRARKLGRHSLRSHIHSCKRFAAFLKRSPETATADDVRRFQLTLIEEEGLTICNRNRVRNFTPVMTRLRLKKGSPSAIATAS